MSQAFTVFKRTPAGVVSLSYTGEVLARGADWVCIVAPFSFNDRDLGYVTLQRGDMFTEWFYSQRYYNIFAIHGRDDGKLKGFYCNITRYAEIQTDAVASDDLALDLWVYPDGRTLLLDEAEYQALGLDEAEQARVKAALDELYQLIATRTPPFEQLA